MMEIMSAIISDEKEVISDYRCFFCFARAFERILDKENLPLEGKKTVCRRYVWFIQHGKE